MSKQANTLVFFLLIVPTILVSAFVLFAYGILGFCIMTACVGSGGAGIEAKLIGAAVALAAALPLIASLTVLIANLRKSHLGSVARTLIWAVIALAGALGYYQVLTDPGDAFWAGIPLLAASALLALSVWSFPRRA